MPKNALYECLDHLTKHKQSLFSHLRERWITLFDARCEILLYDLTSTYFECDPPPPEAGSKKKYGYSRDKRSDCVQVVIALVTTPEGFPLAYEVLPGNTQDNQTLQDFITKIEDQYGKAKRIWVMDRGIPTEEVLEKCENLSRLSITSSALQRTAHRLRKTLSKNGLAEGQGRHRRETIEG